MMYWKLLKILPPAVTFTIFSAPLFSCEVAAMALVVFLNFSVIYLTSEWFEKMDDMDTENFQRQQAQLTEYIKRLNEESAEATKPRKSKSKFSFRTMDKARREKLMKKVHFLLNTTPSEYVLLDRQRQQENAKLLAFLYSLSSIIDRNADWDLGTLSEMSAKNSVVSVYKNIEMRSSCQIPAKSSKSSSHSCSIEQTTRRLSVRSLHEEKNRSEPTTEPGIVEISSSESVTITRDKSSSSYV